MVQINETINFCLDSGFNVRMAINWLSNSGIQNAEGGFHAWYDTEKGKYSFVYPEATAYAVQILSKLYSKSNEDIYLTKAVKAGDWLLNIQKNDGSFASKYFNDSETEKYDRSFHVFDAGIITCGYLDLYKITSKIKYLKAAIKTMHLILKFQNPDGSFSAGLDPHGCLLNNHHWSQTSSCHHIKMLLPLLRLSSITKDKKYFDCTKRLLQWSDGLQLSSGRFITFQGSNETYVHAHCYALEGLIGASKSFGITNDSSISKKLRKGVDWLQRIQNNDGSIWNWSNPHENKIKVCDALSQTMRLFLLSKKEIYSARSNRKIDERVNRGFTFLKKMQHLNGSYQSLGGISYGEANGKKLPHVNTCTTVFAIHAALLRELETTLPLMEEII